MLPDIALSWRFRGLFALSTPDLWQILIVALSKRSWYLIVTYLYSWNVSSFLFEWANLSLWATILPALRLFLIRAHWDLAKLLPHDYPSSLLNQLLIAYTATLLMYWWYIPKAFNCIWSGRNAVHCFTIILLNTWFPIRLHLLCWRLLRCGRVVDTGVAG